MDIYFAKVLEWLEKCKYDGNLDCNWIGLYFQNTTKKSAGPYIGKSLEHLSIEKQYEHLSSAETYLAIPINDIELIITFPYKKEALGTLKAQFATYYKSFPAIKNYLPFNAKDISSDRIILKNLSDSDANDIFEFASNPLVAQFMAWDPHQTIEDSLRMIADAKANYEKGSPIPLGIILKDDPQKKVIGFVGLKVVSARHRIFELVYALGEDYWGKGILVEAAKALIDFSFSHFAINRLQCSCKVENTASARVMEKLGMKYEGILRSYLYLKGEFWDLKMYSLLKSEITNIRKE